MLEKKDLSPEMQAAIRQLQDNMLIALVKRAGGSITFTVAEIDEASERIVLESDVPNQLFTVKLEPKEGSH
jgi:hypothetical protein